MIMISQAAGSGSILLAGGAAMLAVLLIAFRQQILGAIGLGGRKHHSGRARRSGSQRLKIADKILDDVSE